MSVVLISVGIAVDQLGDAGRDAGIGQRAEQLGGAARGLVRRARDDRAAGGERGGDLLARADRSGNSTGVKVAVGPTGWRMTRDSWPRRADQGAAIVALDLLGIPSRTIAPSPALRAWPRRGPCPAPGSGSAPIWSARSRSSCGGLVEDGAALLDIGRAPFGPGAARRRPAPRRGRPWWRKAPRRCRCR